MSEVLVPPRGIPFFVTISLDQDFEPNSSFLKRIHSYFPDQVFVVQEKGESGKLHVHCVGISTRRQDNIRRGIITLLKKKYEVDDRYSVDVMPEPNIRWRLGYLQKESDHKIILSEGFAQDTLVNCLKEYNEKPKRIRAEKKTGALNINTMAKEMIEQGIDTDYAVYDYLKTLVLADKLSFAQYSRINMKKLLAYVFLKLNE